MADSPPDVGRGESHPNVRIEIEEASVRLAIESSTDCIKVLDLDGHLEYMNEGGLCVMEIDDFGDFRGACWPDFWTGEEAPKAEQALALARSGGVGRFQGYTETAKGRMRYWDVTVSPIPAFDGRVDKLLSVSRDITDQRNAEIEKDRLFSELAVERQRLKESEESLQARVESRTNELQRAVTEAEDFNYSIAHDLRSPLRAIAATASILLEELGASLQDDHTALLSRQAHNAIRMGTLIDDLLRLSRLGRADLKREQVNLTELAVSVALEIPTGCTWDIQEQMTADADFGLLRSVLQNLLENSAKFSPLGGVIRVGQRDGVISVSDDGVGFEMQYSGKVFLPFHRLVADHEFPGTGIGLANVKRIVERHGGKVWCESEPGKGSTFSFTLA